MTNAPLRTAVPEAGDNTVVNTRQKRRKSN